MKNKNLFIFSALFLFLSTGLLFNSCTERTTAISSGPADEENIKSVISGVHNAINKRDKDAMIKFYVPDDNALLIGPFSGSGKGDQRVYSNRRDYVNNLFKLFDNISEFQSTPNRDVKIEFFKAGANASVTGKNMAIDNQGQRFTSNWVWTVQLEKRNNKWLIRSDNLKLFPEGGTDIQAAAKACNANIFASIEMKDLNLNMVTKFPVQWYSKVETIPPVDYTASVSLTPTLLMSGDREVGKLMSGVVKFREIVDHVDLIGTFDESSLEEQPKTTGK